MFHHRRITPLYLKEYAGMPWYEQLNQSLEKKHRESSKTLSWPKGSYETLLLQTETLLLDTLSTLKYYNFKNHCPFYTLCKK